jgi:hypothetical protein
MQHLDEGTIHGWLDGALSPEEAARVEAHVGSCSMCADATAEARGLIAASSRILTALDDVPSVRVSPGIQRGRHSLTTWLVREKIAAVMTLVVAGGALALVMARDTPQAARVELASEPAHFEVAAADSPAPPPVAAEELRDAAQTIPSRANVRVAPPSPPSARGVASNRERDSAPTASLLQQGPTVVAGAASAPAVPTDDSVRSVTVAQAERAEAHESSAQASRPAAEKVVVTGLAQQRAADASRRYTEARPAAPTVGATAGVTDGPRLVQEERMIEGGREVRRRIYSVDGVLVTLDERPPTATDLAARGRAGNAGADSLALGTSIRWIDAKGTEFTLTGPAPQERLEQIRKLLGLGNTSP